MDPIKLPRAVFDKKIKHLPRARKGGATVVSHDFIRIITETKSGKDALYNASVAYGYGKVHEATLKFNADLAAMAFYKGENLEDGLRPLGLCDIWERFMESNIAAATLPWMEKYCTSLLPEDAIQRNASIATADQDLKEAKDNLMDAQSIDPTSESAISSATNGST